MDAGYGPRSLSPGCGGAGSGRQHYRQEGYGPGGSGRPILGSQETKGQALRSRAGTGGPPAAVEAAFFRPVQFALTNWRVAGDCAIIAVPT